MKADSKAIVHAVQTVRRLFPDDADKIVIYGKGEDFLSIDIRNEWIFLFPKNPHACPLYECAIVMIEQGRGVKGPSRV